MQDQAVQNMEAMTDRLTAQTGGGSHWGSIGRAWWPGCRPGQEQTGPPKGAGRMRMLGGDSTGEATGSAAADQVRNALREAACPTEEAPS
ncbi:hypothetical protein CVIRNUC_000186 [Coccomyxa viridis]|uniref:Uncharacterized protein n=1 Tax=Coccomyxa viridis TaxID=1274662 RepID=A0AAV1HR56_9CHLO|nr:hypothetical protein CVIRNUC_000186 [Coccomyxa viridis]